MRGGDGGLLEQPIHQPVLTLAQGQRADLLIDLSGIAAGTDIHLGSQAYPEGDAGMVSPVGVRCEQFGMIGDRPRCVARLMHDPSS